MQKLPYLRIISGWGKIYVGEKFRRGKIFVGEKYSSGENFVNCRKFRQFSPTNFSPIRYSLSFKKSVLDFLKATDNNVTATSRKFNINRKNIQRWRKQADRINDANKSRTGTGAKECGKENDLQKCERYLSSNLS